MKKTATLFNKNDIIFFNYGNIIIRFRGPYSLEYFVKVEKYDDGYIEVLTKYKHNDDLEEEYIDLKAIVEDLYMKSDFLKEIDEVDVVYV